MAFVLLSTVIHFQKNWCCRWGWGARAALKKSIKYLHFAAECGAAGREIGSCVLGVEKGVKEIHAQSRGVYVSWDLVCKWGKKGLGGCQGEEGSMWRTADTEARLSVYQSVCIPTLTFGHDIKNNKGERRRRRPWIPAAKWVSSVGRLGSAVKTRSQLRWFLHAHLGGDPGTPSTSWRDYISQLAWQPAGSGSEEERLGFLSHWGFCTYDSNP